MKKSWKDELKDIESGVPPDPMLSTQLKAANRTLIRRSMLGIGPDSISPDARTGQRLVYNVSSAHVASVLKSRYLNQYDLKSILGVRGASRLRKEIDNVVASLAQNGQLPETTYYGAVELNGTGIRYFGDFCLVLKPDPTRDDLMLITNSYDVHREPTRATAFVAGDSVATATNRESVLWDWAGRWPADSPDMAVLKLSGIIATTTRRLTIGTIAANVLVDEDYMEVPRHGSFGATEIEEIRVAASDVAAEARIADRLFLGPTPSMSELLWRHRRRGAEQAARNAGVAVRVVLTTGRDRG